MLVTSIDCWKCSGIHWLETPIAAVQIIISLPPNDNRPLIVCWHARKHEHMYNIEILCQIYMEIASADSY